MQNDPVSLTKVYVFSAHGFVLGELARLLGELGPVEPVRLPHTVAPTPGPLEAGPGTVCVVDCCFPVASCESLVTAIRTACPETRVVALADALAENFAFPLLRAGVKGLLSYAETRDQLFSAVAAVMGGGYWAPRGILSRFLDRVFTPESGRPLPSRTGLSRREQEVLGSVLRNLSNKEIAEALHISERTVKFHVSKLFSKFAVQRRSDLLLQSFQYGFGEA